MIPFTKIHTVLIALVALVLGTPAARAAAGGIQDGGAFFSEQAKAEATRVIGDVQRTVKKDIVIETFAEIPPAMKLGSDLSDKAAANRFFVQWAEKQARLQSVNGVYVLLVKQPAHLQVVVGNQTLKQLFTATDREALVGTMLTKLRAKQNDAALLDGVQFVASTMRAHAGPSAVSSSASNTAPVPANRSAAQPASGKESSSSWIWTAIIIALVVWVGFGLLRSLFGGGAAGGGMAQGAGGGGLFRTLLGSMFGAAAGMWMYDHFFGSHSNASTMNDRHDATGAGDSSAAGQAQDTDYSSSGGDFGSDSGGSFGGSDSSGGDFGGGDFGGGDSGGGDF